MMVRWRERGRVSLRKGEREGDKAEQEIKTRHNQRVFVGEVIQDLEMKQPSLRNHQEVVFCQ